LLYAEGPQSVKCKRVVFVSIIENILEFRVQGRAFSTPWQQGMQKTLELPVFLRENSSAYGAWKPTTRLRTLRVADV